MNNIYVIGDIHGCFETFLALLEKIPPECPVVCAGDLIDRGPKSKEVVDFIMKNERIDFIIGITNLCFILLMNIPKKSGWNMEAGKLFALLGEKYQKAT